MRKVSLSLVVFVLLSAQTSLAATQRVIDEAAGIGRMYDCAEHMPNSYFIANNVGYSFIDDEMTYAYARLLNEKGCHKPGSDKFVIFYISTVNFPSNGIPQGIGSDAEQKWLDYWNYTARRFSDIGYKIIINPMPFIINDNIQNLDYPPGLRPLVKSDLNVNSADIPVVYRCRAGESCIRNGVTTTSNCVTTIASIYDPRTMTMGVNFYTGIRNFFSQYPAFTKISVVPPSDFGEYGFPFGVQGRWWEGSADVYDCYKMGDQYAPSSYSYQNYNQRLNDFMNVLTQNVKSMFPGKRYMVYMGYGDDSNPASGFSYANVVDFAKNNGIDIHSSHGVGVDAMEIPLGKIASNKPSGYEFTFENAGDLNEFTQTKVLYHAAKYGVTGTLLYPQYLYDDIYLTHLTYSMGPSARPSMYATKGITFTTYNGLASLRSSYLINGFMDIPVNGATINGDVDNMIGGWAYYEAPYGDRQYYGVKIYAGHLIENSPYYVDSNTGGKHPEYMRLVASAVTNAERAVGNGDFSRFGASWKPNLASGKVVMRIYIVNGDSQIVAEHPQSPMIININSRISGSASLARNDYDYGSNNVFSRSYTMSGTAADSQRPGQSIPIVIIDEYRGRVLAEGLTNAAGSFSITFSVPNVPGEETQVIVPRAYVDTGTNLIALPRNLTASVGYPTLANKFMSVVSNRNWAPSPCSPNPCTSPWPPACSGNNLVTYSLPGTCTASGGSYTCSYQLSSLPCPSTSCSGSVRRYGGTCSGGSCTFAGTEDCAAKASTDSDNGNRPQAAGTVTDYTGCSSGSCTYSSYADVCSSSTTLVEYMPSDAGYTSVPVNCEIYENYYCNGSNICRTEWGCSGGACSDAAVSDTCNACSFGCNSATYQCNPDPCANVTCNVQQDVCVSNTALRNYTASACVNGICNDTFTDVLCPYACAGGICINNSADINSDGIIDILDLSAIATNFGKTSSHAEWNPERDVVPDGSIDIFDIIFVASRIG